MTPHEIELTRSLASCSMLPGTSHKRFVRNLAFVAEHEPAREISLRQRHYLELMAWRYRRQLPRHLVPDCKPLTLPPKRKPEKAVKATRKGLKNQVTEEKDLFSC